MKEVCPGGFLSIYLCVTPKPFVAGDAPIKASHVAVDLRDLRFEAVMPDEHRFLGSRVRLDRVNLMALREGLKRISVHGWKQDFGKTFSAEILPPPEPPFGAYDPKTVLGDSRKGSLHSLEDTVDGLAMGGI